MSEIVIRMPKAKNTFTGRVTMSLEEFETFKTLANCGILRIICTDGFVKSINIEQWMIDHSVIRSSANREYMLVTFSKHRRQNDLLTAKKLGYTWS